jgi:cytochrome d ubiquinol oxidase subunit II
MSTAVAIVLFFGVVAYSMFAGADFGAGMWDLLAGGEKRGERPRALVDHSIGPVWEANHVWLIFCLVVLWTAFSAAFSEIMLVLFVPLTLAALGIVLRGSSFAFRKSVFVTRQRRRYGAIFAGSSVLVPYCMGAVAGAIASGRVVVGGKHEPWSSWINPTSVLGGVMAIVMCAFLSAVYMTWDAKRLEAPDMIEYYRRRAVIAAVVAGVVAFAGIFVLRSDAPYIFHGLTSRAAPLVVLSAICGLGALWALFREAHRFARPLAMGAVAAVIVGWGVAQWPYLLPTTMKVQDAAAPDPTLATVLVVFGVAAVTIVPSLALLYVLDQKNVLEDHVF